MIVKKKIENQDVKQHSNKKLRRLKRRDLLQFLLESEEELQQVKQTLAQERILRQQLGAKAPSLCTPSRVLLH